MVHPYNGILLQCKKEQTINTYNNADGPQNFYAKVKEARHKSLHTA